MSILVRTQLMLTEEQRDALNRIAKENNSSISDVVRKMINAQLRQQRYEKMGTAAMLLKHEYEHGGALDFPSIHSENPLRLHRRNP